MQKSTFEPLPISSVLAFPDTSVNKRNDIDRATTYMFIFGFVICSHVAWSAFGAKYRRSQQKLFKPALWYKHLDPILGLDVLWICAKAVAGNRLLEVTQNLLSPFGRTVSYLHLGRQAVLTIDPVNLKSMLSVRFADFGLGGTRKNGLQPLFGTGIFNSDGEIWKVGKPVNLDHFRISMYLLQELLEPSRYTSTISVSG
jgi:hypothetical protein